MVTSKKTSKKVVVTVATRVAATENPLKRHENDTGSSETQIWLLSDEIGLLQAHLNEHPKDVDAKRSLLKKVARRRRFLKYLKETKIAIYTQVSKKLNLKV